MKKCAHCKKMLLLDMFHKNRSTKDGLHHTCIECCLENKHKYKYRRYRDGAEKRNLLFDLSEYEFYDFISNTVCYYCGDNYNLGIDRIDSNIGYERENIVPCCGTCNIMKREMDLEKFINKCSQISKYYKEV